MGSAEHAVDENRVLRRTMRDLVAFSTLPALWIGLDATGIARSLADVLRSTLSLDLVYVRFSDPAAGADEVEVFRHERRPGATSTADAATVRASLAALLSDDPADQPTTIADPFGSGRLHVAITRFGVADDHGVLITGSHAADFPTERDRLLLGVGANQAAAVIQRQRTEQQLHERREWLRVTLASIGDAVIATDVEARIVFLNPVAEQLTGWAAHEAEGKPLDAVFVAVHEQTRQPVESPVAKVLQESGVVGLPNHTVLVAKDGRHRPIDDAAAPIRDRAGKLIGAVLTFRDVTERRQAEHDLRESEARKSAMLESALDCVVSMDHEGKVVEWNPAAERTFGYRRSDAIGRQLSELIIPPELRESHRRGLTRYLATGTGALVGKRLELPALRSDGTRFPVELAIVRIPTSGPPLFTAYLRDISERIRSERHRNVRLLVTQALAQATTLAEAATTLLQGVCESLGWDAGVIWTLGPDADALQFLRGWHAPGSPGAQLITASGPQAFRRGEGLPGETWHRGEPVWLPDVARAVNFTRASSAAADGLHAAFACPLALGSKTLGVIEFFSRQIQAPDSGLLETMATVSGLIGQFVERKQAEEALQRSEARFRGLMEQAPFSIQVFANDGRTVQVNRAWEELWGVKFEQLAEYNVLEDKQLQARGVLHHIHQGFAGQTAHIPAIQYNPNDTIPDVTQVDDPRRWLAAVIYPLKDADGAVHEVVLIHEDITARTLAEEALRESRERLDLALQAADLGHWVLNLSDHTASRNQRHDQIFGYDSLVREWTYDMFLGHVVPEERASVDAGFRQALETGTTWDCECQIRRRDGSLRWIWIRGRSFKEENGKARRVAGTVADISDRKHIEEQLRHARARLEAALSAGAIATWMWDIPNNLLFADEALARLFGLDPAEAAGGLLDKYEQAIHPDDRARVMAVLGRAVDTGEDYEADYRIVQQDGSVRWVAARGRAERDATGRPVRMPGVLVDITERKRLEEALRDTDRRKDEFLATLAHELRNPLAPIRNSLQILKMPRVDAAMAQRTRDIMERQVQHLVRLVDDLLDVSRVMRGKIELRKERVELATVVARAVETAQPLIEVQGHELDISLPAESLLLDADPVRLSQVVGNLLTNAAKYTEPGGHIWLSARRDGDAAVLHVRDDGIGIAAAMLPQVFELFVQVDHATTRSQGGLGIGLTLVKNLVDLHGGSVEARSRGLGRGSEFVVRLPLTVPAHHRVEDEARGEQPQAAMPTGHRVLVVDDNDDAAMSLALVLELKGHVVRVVHDGASALEAVRTFGPALILLDLGMPEMDGFEVARRIRRMPAAANTVIAALTGWGQKEDRRRTAEAGFDHHLVKPVEPTTLERLLAALTAAPAKSEGREPPITP